MNQDLGPSHSEASAPNVTPEMAEAGVRVLCEHCPDTANGDVLDYRMVEEIFRAMVEAGPTERWRGDARRHSE